MTSAAMVASCARCHARRSSIDDFSHSHGHMMDSMIPSLLTPALYHADGQILDEVYVYGSFTQSKMFLRDVKCNDCHDVHSQKLKQEGNALCLNCHRKEIYDTKDHHFHKPVHEGKESPGDDCIKCHMPETPYMGIDFRADHSIRIPRPDLSESYGIPNACNAAGCHSDKSLQWTNEKMTEWYGKRNRKHYASAIFNGRQGSSSALDEIIGLAKDQLSPAIVRATALDLLIAYPVSQSFEVLKQALIDPDPLIRQTAISTINQLRFDKDARLIFPLLYDPVNAVRIQAALAVVSLQNLDLSSDQKTILNRGIEEYIDAMAHAGDFPSGRFNLGLLYSALGETKKKH
jgi:predicted CXXCH cytochrome family protein